ncbi:Cytosolic seryl-tRNA synthetase [Globomyces sp. JEL0801]|nr:Cytosolic seryl-tRNA synthetase [Globomyces sp. JEL0801]
MWLRPFTFLKKKSKYFQSRTMIDINLLRADKGGNPDLVRESQRKRARFNANELNKQINEIGKKIQPLAKAKKLDSPEALELKNQKDTLTKQQEELKLIATQKEQLLNKKLRLIGNIVHESVVDSNDEANNKIIGKWWPQGRDEDSEKEKRGKLVVDGKGVPGLYSHHEVLEKISGYDPVRGANVAGHRGYFLTGPGVDLNLALMQYGLDFLENNGYTKLWTPFFMRKEMMSKTAQLEEFDEALYNVSGEEGDEKYLIATSEQPISAFHADEWFSDASELPKKKEAGAHGRDTWGIFRVHQFEKIEQFCLTEPEKSWDMHLEMLHVAEQFYRSLGLPYHVISIVSGALNNSAAAKYDLEAYFPFQGEYKELVSCSNCTDYQTRELEIRFGAKKMNDTTKKYVHALNCTLTATERTMCCILENYQTENGFIVPEVLRKYMNGKEFIPFKEEKKAKKEKKGSDVPKAAKKQ